MPGVVDTFAMRLMCLVVSFTAFLTPTAYGDEQDLTGRDIVKRCGFKNPGRDQRSGFTVLLRDRHGNIKKSVYQRLWKDYRGKDGIANKMLLFTEFPPEAKGAAFMRVVHGRAAGKKIDQWIYLPVLRKIRRVTIRDPGDSFLNSDLSYADIMQRALDEDTHTFTGIRKVRGIEFYVVESIPKEKKPLYSKRVLWFLKTPDWNDCTNARIDYYGRKGSLLKEQFIKWQHINGAWVWDRVLVRNRQTLHATIFLLTDVKINTGLEDGVFSERILRLGPSAMPKHED